MGGIYLLTTLFSARSRERADELIKCIQVNASNKHIRRVIVFFEHDGEELPEDLCHDSLKNQRIRLLHIRHRPTFRLLFDYANRHLSGSHIIISNTDIFFDADSGVERIHEIKRNHLWTITRHNHDHKTDAWKITEFGKGGSDCYFWRAPMKNFENNILIGVHGCDAYLSQKAVEAGITVCNPALSIAAKHLHNSRERSYLDIGGLPNYREREDYLPLGRKWYLPKPSTMEKMQTARKGFRFRCRSFLHQVAKIFSR